MVRKSFHVCILGYPLGMFLSGSGMQFYWKFFFGARFGHDKGIWDYPLHVVFVGKFILAISIMISWVTSTCTIDPFGQGPLFLASIHMFIYNCIMYPQVPYIWMFPKIVGFPPKSSISIGLSITSHPFWGPTPIVGSTYIFFCRSFWTIKKLLDDSTTWLTSRTPRICFTSSGWSIGRTLNICNLARFFLTCLSC